jgi:hypothetical protein
MSGSALAMNWRLSVLLEATAGCKDAEERLCEMIAVQVAQKAATALQTAAKWRQGIDAS